MRYLVKNYFLLSLLFLSGCLESSREAPDDLIKKYGDEVVLYSASWCGYCRQTREILEANYIQFQEIDVEASPVAAAEFQKLGGRGVPLVLAKGRVVEGFAPKAVLDLINGAPKG